MSTRPRISKRKQKSAGTNFAPVFVAAIADSRNCSVFKPKQVIFAQGDVADSVFYIRKGKVMLTVVSGEGCLIGQSRRRTSAMAMSECEIVQIDKDEIIRMIEEAPTFAQMFITHILAKNARIEDDLVDYHFNSTEKRLARALLLLANFGRKGRPQEVVERISQEMLAEMIGATRSRVSYFMNKFRQLGFIDYNGQHLEVRSSLSQVVLSEELDMTDDDSQFVR